MKPYRTVNLAALFALLALATQAFAADWPRWRGPDLNGISKETGLLKQWPAEGPKTLWSVNLGPGYASATVVGGKVYTMYQDDQNQYLVALDEKTGQEAWKVTTGPIYKCMTKHNGPRSTPTVEGDVVYALDGNGVLVCAQAADGKEIWKKNILELAGGKNLPWGMAGSPYISGDMLIVNPGAKGASVMALNKKTGDVIWKSGDDIAGYSTAVAFNNEGADQFIVFSGKSIGGYAAKDGKPLWSHPWKTSWDVNAANPIVIDGDVFLTSGYGSGCARLKIAGGKVTEVWKNKKIDVKFGPTPLVLDGFIYGNNEKAFVCLDAKTGDVKWEEKGKRGAQYIYADGMFYCMSEDGVLRLAKMSPEKCEIISEVKVFPGEQRWCTPVVANGKLFVRDDKRMICFDIAAK